MSSDSSAARPLALVTSGALTAALAVALAACDGRETPDVRSAPSGRDAPAVGAATPAAPTPAPAATAGTANPRPQADSAVGRVVVVGPDPVSWVALAEPGGAQLRLSGRPSEALRGVAGVEAIVHGTRGGRDFRVERFTVRRANGIAVDDGVIAVRGDTVLLMLSAGGSRVIRDAPPELRALTGARVWVTPSAAGVVPTYGVIARR